ncbi:18S rRNA maturation protein [Paramarasmius palmivorus]|uniref:rRNA-processing protein EFG1 n=1 Tax=Paramarasmius palmivorus TaxID=297713 RepID=A0AAW0DMF3_9AGAR
MGPVRTQKQSQVHSQSSHSKTKRKSNRSQHTEADSNTLPGVQKIKAAIRQTRRLLAKEKLAADVRVNTERKLKSLEADLAKAEESRKEKALATKYHAIKFFERKKVTRKINQVKKKLSEASGSSSKEKLEAELSNLRLDLNYILHYPKLKKYIALFPPEVRQGSKPSPETSSENATTDAEREEIRRWIREEMEKGTMALEPEHAEDSGQLPKAKAGPSKWDKKSIGQPHRHKEVKEVEEESSSEKDDFFEDDGDDDDS